MNDTDLLSQNYLEESLTGSLIEDPNELEALFEGGDDVRFCIFTASENEAFVDLSFQSGEVDSNF